MFIRYRTVGGQVFFGLSRGDGKKILTRSKEWVA